MKKLLLGVFVFIAVVFISYGQSADEFFESGKTKFNEGDYRGCIEDMTTTIELDSLHVEAWMVRGDAWEELGIHGEAHEDWMQSYYLSAMERFEQRQVSDACRYWNMAAEMGHEDAQKMYKKNCRNK